MFVSALILGLLGSFHCIGMCGPIAFMLPVDRTSMLKRSLQVASYHLGRLFTYSLIGLLFGLLGKGFYFFGFQQQLSVITGIAMILVILLPKTFQKYNFSKTINKWVMKIKSSLGKELKKKGNDTFFTIGFFNGFLPCGLVYMAIFGALATTNAFSGSFYMFVFGIGTIPLMTAVVFFGNVTNIITRKKIQQIIPYVVVVIGVLFVLRGLGLGIPYISPTPVTNLVTSVQGCS